MKKALSILLSLLLVFGTVAFSLTAAAEAPTIIDQGYCGGEGDGTNVTWVLTNDGTLTIRGEGEMNNYAYVRPDAPDTEEAATTPWYPHVKEIRAVTIGNGVTTIGDYAFFSCGRLSNVTLPESLRSIGTRAFCLCSALTEILLPNSLRAIGNGAFLGTSFTSIVIPEGVERLEHATFAECFNLKRITLPVSMKYIANNTFYEAEVHVAEYHGTQEQWDQIYIWDEESAFDYLLHQAYQNYLSGHEITVERVVEGQPTCTETGRYSVKIKCTKGDTVFGSPHDVWIAPINHAHKYDAPATEATATEHGYTAGIFCPDCQTWLSGHDVIHNALGEQRVIKEPTETEEGIVEIRCTVCGEWGQYTADPTGSQPDDDNSGGFWVQIQSFFRGIIDWFLRLFKWLG